MRKMHEEAIVLDVKENITQGKKIVQFSSSI